MVEVDDFEPGVSTRVVLLHHAAVPEIIIAATTRTETAQRVLARRGLGAKAYRFALVPVLHEPEKRRRKPRAPHKLSAKRRPPSTSSPSA